MAGRLTDFISTILTAKTTTIDGTEYVTILNSNGGLQKATLLDHVRYVLANAFGTTNDLNIMNRIYVKAATKTLTESSATGCVDVAVASGSVANGRFYYSIQANDASDYQAISGSVNWSVVNKAGTLTAVLSTPVESNAVSSGTLTVTVTAATGTNKITLSLNAVSSLTQTTLRAKWQLQHDGYATITAL